MATGAAAAGERVKDAMHELHAHAEQRGETLFVSLAGEFDISNAGRLTRETAPFTFGDVTGIDVDLTCLNYVDSTGLRDFVLLRHKADAAHIPLTLYVQTGSTVCRMLNLLGFPELAHVVEVPQASEIL